MKSTAVLLVSCLALASRTSAQLLSYAHPIVADHWTAGSTAPVTWSNACTDVVGNTTFPIYLNYQVGAYQVQYPGIPALGYLDCSSAGSVTVPVPMVPQGSTYSILVTDGSNQSYSAQFTIDSTISPVATTGTVIATTLPTTAAATTAMTTTSLPTTTQATTTATTGTPKPTSSNQAGALKAGSTVALVIVAAVASLVL